MTFLKNFFNEEDGQGMVEYGLVISLVVIGGVAAYTAFGNSITGGMNTLGNSVKGSL